jgi:hypothetical protein
MISKSSSAASMAPALAERIDIHQIQRRAVGG